MSSPATTKQLDSVTLLLKQTLAPTQLIPTVQTRLENPTRYHLEQISRKQTLVDDDDSSLTQTTILPQEESSPDSEITSEMDDQLNDDATCGSIDSNTQGISITPRLSTTVTGDHVGSVFLSSSLSKDGLDSSNRHSSSCPTNILSAKAKIGLPLTDDEMRLVIRDRQKKDNHNMIERRRRFNINDRIKELGTLLPKGTDLDSKQNKGTILRASVDYIKILRRQYDNASLIDEKCHILTEQNLALQERIKELERKCLSNGIPISSSAAIKSTPAIAVVHSNIVKQEPSSLSSSFNNNPLVPPSTPIFATFDSLPPLDSLSPFGIVDEDSNDTNSVVGNTSTDPLSPLTHDPFLSSTSFGFDNEMDIGGGFP
jgi:transcription factor E3